MLKKICVALACMAIPLLAEAQSCHLPDGLWERPRSGKMLLDVPPLRACVQSYLDMPGSALVIHHAAMDEASLRAAELRYWLIALALDGARINLQNDLPPKQPLTVEVREKK